MTDTITGTGDTRPMRFAVDGWDPSYGASLDLDEEPLTESTATIGVDVELPARRWRPIDAGHDHQPPSAVLFVDGVRRVEARVWIEDSVQPDGTRATEATPALCASYAAGVVCCAGERARLVGAQLRRGLFSVAPHAGDIRTRAGVYAAHRVAAATAVGGGGAPLMARLSQALQRRLSDIEMTTAAEARSLLRGQGASPADTDDDLLIIDGPLRGRQHLPRALGYIKSHRTTYLPPELNVIVGSLEPGQRTPVFLMGTSWDRHTWYLRLPGAPGAPWAGIVRVECAADLPAAEVTRLANLSQAFLGRFASSPYKDSRAPQNLYPIGGLERELRHRLGDPRYLYRALREASAGRPGRGLTTLRPPPESLVDVGGDHRHGDLGVVGDLGTDRAHEQPLEAARAA